MTKILDSSWDILDNLNLDEDTLCLHNNSQSLF